MKKLITILLASSLGFTAAASAKDDKKKNKSGPPQQHQQQFKTAPQTKMKVQNNSKSMSNARSNSAKVQMNELRNSNVVKPHKTPVPNTLATDKFQKNTKSKQFNQQQNLQTNQLQNNHKNQKNWVNNQQNTPNLQNHAKYKDFKAHRSSTIASVQFNQNYRIQNSQNWNGPQYRVFQSYRPQWHDRSWWHSRYASNILLIGGGYYYWNSGYWYPAWGYDSAYSYYPYDGPIYVGDNQVPFDRVLANVQSSLQEQGYYRGEIDGLMGPLTRDALANYQRDHGLVSTAALDQPTLASLGLG
jgi:Putative peptidoglycan binding domain